MKVPLTAFLLLFLAFAACKTEKKAKTPESSEGAPGILEKVAMAHGFDRWKDVRELRFTFNVDRDTSHFERSWIWHPPTNEVTLIASGDTITYQRAAVDSTLTQQDAGFINDKYWFLAPFQLIWDQESFTHELAPQAVAPISGAPMQKLTIVYGNAGGYTPGDAYDLYLDENYMVREWTFRRSNKPAPGSDASWEGYTTLEGLQLSTMHQLGGGARLYFTGVEVKTQ